MAPTEASTPKGAQTRERIVEVALRLFREKGYEKTTMRAIANAAGVSLGNAYYYFRSKDELIQGFYSRIQEDHRDAAVPVLAHKQGFKQRLLHVLLAWHDVARPYHAFAGVLFRHAADPRSPLNPFSPESAPAREASTAILRDAVTGARERFPRDLEERLPELLWLFHIAIVLYWVHDRSPGLEKSRRLVERGTDLVCRLLALIRPAPMKPLRSLVLRTYAELTE